MFTVDFVKRLMKLFQPISLSSALQLMAVLTPLVCMYVLRVYECQLNHRFSNTYARGPVNSIWRSREKSSITGKNQISSAEIPRSCITLHKVIIITYYSAVHEDKQLKANNGWTTSLNGTC